jgi:hypothetical protein
LKISTGHSTARLVCLLWEQEVAGSNPAAPTEKIKPLDHISKGLIF